MLVEASCRCGKPTYAALSSCLFQASSTYRTPSLSTSGCEHSCADLVERAALHKHCVGVVLPEAWHIHFLTKAIAGVSVLISHIVPETPNKEGDEGERGGRKEGAESSEAAPATTGETAESSASAATTRVVNRLFRADFFGETALLKNEARNATVTAAGSAPLVCLCLIA